MYKNPVPLLAVTLLLASCIKEKCPDPEPPVPVQKTISIQPGTTSGKDAFVVYHASTPSAAESNIGNEAELHAFSWTNGGSLVSGRMFVFFPFDSVPSGAEILSAKLTLYGINSSLYTPQGNSGDNKLYVQRVVQNWTENTINWNNQPAVTTEGQVQTTASATQWNYNLPDLDITGFVKVMIASNNNYGFCLRLVTEQTYRSIIFSSSEATDAAKRPKLVIEYKK